MLTGQPGGSLSNLDWVGKGEKPFISLNSIIFLWSRKCYLGGFLPSNHAIRYRAIYADISQIFLSRVKGWSPCALLKTNIYWKEKPPVEEKGLILSLGFDRPARQTPGTCMHCWIRTQENCRNHVLSGVSGNSFLRPRFHISLFGSILIYPPASSCLGVLEIPENQDRESGCAPQDSACHFPPAPPNAPFYQWLNPHSSTGQHIIGALFTLSLLSGQGLVYPCCWKVPRKYAKSMVGHQSIHRLGREKQVAFSRVVNEIWRPKNVYMDWALF